MQVGAGCVFRDRLGRILLVKPTYKEEWELPGGAAEEGESPLCTCQREIKEELGLDVVPERLVAIDYREPIPDRRGSALRFVFSGGVLDEAEVEAIRLDSTELSDFRFVSIDELSSHVTPGDHGSSLAIDYRKPDLRSAVPGRRAGRAGLNSWSTARQQQRSS